MAASAKTKAGGAAGQKKSAGGRAGGGKAAGGKAKGGKAAAKPKGEPKRVTESLDTSARKVGPLSIFGISELWKVPTILPK